jgi:hypothetical protein
MVAMLGLDTIGASLTGGLDTPMVPAQAPDWLKSYPMEKG